MLSLRTNVRQRMLPNVSWCTNVVQGLFFIADCCNLQLTFLMLYCMLQLMMRRAPSVKCMIRRLFGSSDVYVAIVYVAVM